METIAYKDIDKTLLGWLILHLIAQDSTFKRVFDEQCLAPDADKAGLKTPQNMQVCFSINGVELPVVKAFTELEEQNDWRIRRAARQLLDERLGDFTGHLYELGEAVAESATNLLGIRYDHKGNVVSDEDEEEL